MRKQKFFKFENAQTMVEFALVFPIILLITYGIIEFGRMVFIYAAVTSGVREGARYGSAAGVGANGFPQYADCAGIKEAVRHTAILVTIPDDVISISYEISPSPGWTYSCSAIQADPSLVHLGDRVLVHARVQYQPLIGSFLGVTGFPIDTSNARTILKKVEFEDP